MWKQSNGKIQYTVWGWTLGSNVSSTLLSFGPQSVQGPSDAPRRCTPMHSCMGSWRWCLRCCPSLKYLPPPYLAQWFPNTHGICLLPYSFCSFWLSFVLARVCLYFIALLKWGLNKYFRLVSNLWPSCLSLNVQNIGMSHHTQQLLPCLKFSMVLDHRWVVTPLGVAYQISYVFVCVSDIYYDS